MNGQTVPQKRKGLTFSQKKQLSYWVFLIPFLFGFIFIFAGIYASSLQYSFNSLSLGGEDGFTMTWVGMKNYSYALLEDPYFRNDVQFAVTEMMMLIPLVVIFSLFIAVLLNRKMKGRMVYRAIFFIPVILATGFMTKADIYSLVSDSMAAGANSQDASGTVAGGLLNALDISEYLINLSFSPQLSGYVISGVNRILDIVNKSGVQILIFLAGLQSISPTIYESANIDGATGWESFWLITFPNISPIILVNMIYTIVDSLTAPDNIIMRTIQQQTFKSNGMGLASAMAWFYFLVVLVCIAAITSVVSGYIYYNQKD